MMVVVTAAGAVDCRAEIDLGLSATSVWGQLRDFQRYARQDFFHAEIIINGAIPRAGAKLTMRHRYAGFTVRRLGRILVWREGIGYSFGDLSLRGPRRGFPHVLSYRIEPLETNKCRIHIRVRGRWTLRWIPKWMCRLWLRWIFGHMVRSVQNELLMYAIWRRDKRRKSISNKLDES